MTQLGKGARLELVSHSPEDTRRIGRALGRAATGGEVILLIGPLGAGKTCLAQGIAQGLQVSNPALSPSFVLIREHQGRLPFYHIDLYRVDRPDEVEDLGLDEYLYGDGVSVVEWAERAMALLPVEHLLIRMEYVSVRVRGLTFEGSPRYEALLHALIEAKVRG